MAAKERPDGIRRPAAERREQILDVAAEAFAESGFRGTSLADVAARVGVSQPGLLHHYRTKQLLILAVLAERDRQDGEHLRQCFGGTEPTTTDWALTVARRNLQEPELVRLFTVTGTESLDPSHPAHAFSRERFERNRDWLAGRVRADQEQGHLASSLDPVSTAKELLAVMHGLQLQWLMDPDTDLVGILASHLERLAAQD